MIAQGLRLFPAMLQADAVHKDGESFLWWCTAVPDLKVKDSDENNCRLFCCWFFILLNNVKPSLHREKPSPPV
jgi:hypothetical protein